MVCNRDGCRTSTRGAALGVPDTETIQMAARRGRNCPDCGSFLRKDGTCSRCGRQPRGLEAQQQNSPAHMTAGKYLAKFGEDPLRSPALAGMYGRYATNISRQGRRQVVLDESIGTAATDLQGTIMLNPQPLGPSEPITNQLAVGLGMLEHEILHELYSPRWSLEETYDTAIARGYGQRVGEKTQLDARGKLFTQLFNILEDARIERIAQKQHPGVWKRIWAVHQHMAKDGGYGDPQLLETLPATDQAVVCLLNDVQPGYSLTPDMWAVLKPEVQAALRDALPHAQRAVTGDARTALDESLALWDALEQHGMLPQEMPLKWMTTHQGGADADGDAAAGGGGAEQAAAGRSRPAHCPQCGGFLDEQGVCTKCGHQGPQPQQSCPSQSGSQEGTEDEQAAGTSGADRPNPDGGDKAGDDDSGQSGASSEGAEGEDAAGVGGADHLGPDGGDSAGDGDGGPSSASSEDAEGAGDAVDQSDAISESPDAEDVASADDDSGSQDGTAGDDGGQSGASSESAESEDAAGASDADCPSHGDGESRQSGSGGKGAGGGSGDDEPPRFLDAPPDAAEQDAAKDAMEESRRVATSLFDGAEHQATTEREKRVGRQLHTPLKQPVGTSMSVTLEDGTSAILRSEISPETQLDGRRATLKAMPQWAEFREELTQQALPLGKRLGRQLLALKTKAQATRRFQKSGQLDRGRLIAGSKGASRIYQRQGSSVGRSIAASIALDVSGSMDQQIYSGDLYRAALATAVALRDADIPFEMTRFDSRCVQMVPFDSPARGPELFDRIDAGTYRPLASTRTDDAMMAGALSLLARDEEHKLQFVMTDGVPNSQTNTQAVGNEVRKRGVATIGVVFADSRHVSADAADAMFGRGSWFRITSLEELPQLAAETIKRVIREGERR